MDRVVGATQGDDVEALRRLLDEDPGLIEAEYPMPLLIVASLTASLGAARLLIERGAALDAREETNGLTPLMVACHTGDVGMAALLLDRGADPTLRNTRGLTPLMIACCIKNASEADHVAVIRLILQCGRAPVDATESRGLTALWLACTTGFHERARVLLLEGLADHSLLTHAGANMHDVTRLAGQDQCVELLEWYEGELQRAFLLSKARAVLDNNETIPKALEKAQGKTRAQAQRAREKTAPAWLRGRVGRGEALPVVEVVGQRRRRPRGWEQEEEEERAAVCELLVKWLPEELYVEMMEGLRLR